MLRDSKGRGKAEIKNIKEAKKYRRAFKSWTGGEEKSTKRRICEEIMIAE